MRIPRTAGIGIAAAFAVGISGLAQAQAPSTSKNTGSGVTVVGCLISESNYRQAHNLGKGALGGAGLGDEFVLVDATMTPAANVPSPSSARRVRPAPTPSANAQSCTEGGTGQAYRVTGHREEELKAFVGRRLEITGTLEHASNTTASAAASSGKLPEEIDMASYKEVTSPAPEAVTPPAPPEPRTEPAPRPEPTPSAPPVSQSARALPRTAGPDATIALFGLLSLATGSGLWLTCRRQA